MQGVHNPHEGQFYVCDAEAIHAVQLDNAGEEVVQVPRRVTPLRGAKVQSTKAFFLGLSSREKVAFVTQLPAEERKVLWNAFTSSERTQHLTTFVRALVHARPSWLPASYSFVG